MSDAGRPFDPTPYLTQIRGKGGGQQYLEVKWRVLWLRSAHPDAVIETQAVSIGEREAVFRATVTLPSGGKATGYGSETQGDFGDFIEKAESKALGRALAHLGFGTQFATELHEGGVVGTPVGPDERDGRQTCQDRPGAAARATMSQSAALSPAAAPGATPPATAPANVTPVNPHVLTERQRRFIDRLAREHAISEEALHQLAKRLFRADRYDGLSRRDASQLIEHLQQEYGTGT